MVEYLRVFEHVGFFCAVALNKEEIRQVLTLELHPEAREKQIRGKVLVVGPGKLLDSGKRGQMSARKGDSVYYGKFAGTEIELATEELVVLREEDALVVVEPHN